MLICVECATEMRCDKNDVGALWGEAHVRCGDRFVCPWCGRKILNANDKPIVDRGLKAQDEYLRMDAKEESNGRS